MFWKRLARLWGGAGVFFAAEKKAKMAIGLVGKIGQRMERDREG